MLRNFIPSVKILEAQSVVFYTDQGVKTPTHKSNVIPGYIGSLLMTLESRFSEANQY